MKAVHETVPREAYGKDASAYAGGSHVDTLLRRMHRAVAARRSPAAGRKDV